MKILDRYILSRFLYNFFSSFVILMFIFIFQTIWLFIDDLAGRGLDIVIIGKFLFYLTPNLTEKVLPLTVLLSSILTFGTFAENYEFAAMKASGISLQKAMKSLIVFVVLLGGFTFYFANNVIPPSEQKIYNMRKNIGQVKPAAVIAEGVFSDFEGMNIKVDNKYGDNDRFLDNIIIHKQNPKTNTNSTVIKAKKGELVSSEKSSIVQLILRDGHYYEDVYSKSGKEKRQYPFAKSNFETYTMNINLSELNDEDLEADRDVTTDKMKNVSRLAKDMDSIKKNNIKVVTAFSKNILNKMGGFLPVRIKDSIKYKNQRKDSLQGAKALKPVENQKEAVIPIEHVINLFQEWKKIQLITSAKNSTSNILSSVKNKKDELQKRYKMYNMHVLSLHNKFAFALSCIILFFVGAPLGAIIRKGGLGLPMVIAIILFLTYYFIGVFAGNSAKENSISPILGAWLPTIIMLPLSVFLTRRATADKGLISIGSIGDFFKNLFKKKNRDS